MTTSRGHYQPQFRLDALKAKHAALSSAIEEQRKYPATSNLDLHRLKLEKLRIKEEIENIRQAS
jgi:hypothetical protein